MLAYIRFKDASIPKYQISFFVNLTIWNFIFESQSMKVYVNTELEIELNSSVCFFNDSEKMDLKRSQQCVCYLSQSEY